MVEFLKDTEDALRDVLSRMKDKIEFGLKMILNAAFLVERDREAQLDQRVQELAQRYEGRLRFHYTGPWPPYNFVHIRLKLERAGARS